MKWYDVVLINKDWNGTVFHVTESLEQAIMVKEVLPEMCTLAPGERFIIVDDETKEEIENDCI